MANWEVEPALVGLLQVLPLVGLELVLELQLELVVVAVTAEVVGTQQMPCPHGCG